MGRRQFGAVRRLPSGRYQARLPDGTAAPQTFSAKADATRWLATVETDILRGTFVTRGPATDLTVGEWLEESRTKHSLHKRPGTLARDRSAIRTHIEPGLGSIPLSALKPQEVQGFVAGLTDTIGAGTGHSVYGGALARRNGRLMAARLCPVARRISVYHVDNPS